MAVAFDPSTDFEDICDGLQAVTVVVGETESGVTHALRRAVSIREAEASNGKVKSSDVAWHLPLAEQADQPQLGAVIRDSGGTAWTILDVAHQTLTRRWRCVARNLAIDAGLDTQITIEKAAWGKGDGGAAKATWKSWQPALAARIQPQTDELVTEHERQSTRRRYRITVARTVAFEVGTEPSHDYRVKDRDGTTYNIVSYEQSEDIAALPVIVAERTPWPHV